MHRLARAGRRASTAILDATGRRVSFRHLSGLPQCSPSSTSSSRSSRSSGSAISPSASSSTRARASAGSSPSSTISRPRACSSTPWRRPISRPSSTGAVIIPFYVGALVVFAVASVVSVKVFGNRPGEGVAAGFTAMFTNTVLIGLPLRPARLRRRCTGHHVLDHRLPRLGSHHRRHADDGARSPRRRAAPSGARRCLRSHRLEPAALGHRRGRRRQLLPAQDARAGRRLPRDDGRGRRSRSLSSASAARSTSIGSRRAGRSR